MTVRQIANQRNAMYRPELAFSQIYFDARCDVAKDKSFPCKWVPKDSKEVTKKNFDPGFKIPMENVGLGAAKSVSISWSFPLEKTVDEVNALCKKLNASEAFVFKDGKLVKSVGEARHISYWENQRNLHFDYVLPVSTQRSAIMVQVPDTFIQLYSAFVFLETQRNADEWNYKAPPLVANVEYLDIGNMKHKAVFDFQFEVISIEKGGKVFDGYFDCHKRK
ncbi:hypothetical protein [Undibacterium sp.]|uniref:hypothetical protein n=1 Tax=Undibacterium sp. TaxID=1914977 RepID=UPI0027310FCB|nr:hypothetical protein [Undibacterium sp.]MDP1978288.1 hypothetical protein [Undibacterium sp.]